MRIRHGREVDEHCALGSSVAASASRVLPVPPGPVSVTRRMSSRRRSAADGRDLEVAADQRRRRSRARPAAASVHGVPAVGRDPGSWRRICCSSAELRAGLEAELVERGARVAVGGEGVRLAPGAVEGEHEQGAEGLAVGMRRNKSFELCGERRCRRRRRGHDRCGPRGRRAAIRRAARRRRGRRARRPDLRGPAPARGRARPEGRRHRAGRARWKRSASSSPGWTWSR